MRNTVAATATITATATAPVTIAIAAPAMGTRMYIHRDKKTVGAAATSPPAAGGGTCFGPQLGSQLCAHVLCPAQ